MKAILRVSALLAIGVCLGGLAACNDGRERLSEPRIPPLTKAEWGEDARLLLEPIEKDGRLINVYKTLARHPKLFDRFTQFGGYILRDSTLPPREREIVILRIGWLCRAEYEFGRHRMVGLGAGLTEDEVRRITKGPDAAGWDAFDATLLRAADELHRDAFVTDATWAALSERYDTHQLMDLVFTVGQYNLVSMALNSFGVQLEEGVAGFPQ
jgi:4-carboxymuconolactone decarboxylase